MTIKNFTFFSPNGTEFPVGSNNDGKLYMMLTGLEYNSIRRKDWDNTLTTALNIQYVNTSIVAGGRYFELVNESVALQANAVNYIHVNIDLTNTTAPVSLSAETTDNSNSLDLNNKSGVYKVVIDIVTTDGQGVISKQAPRNITVLDQVNTKTVNVEELNVSGDIKGWTNVTMQSVVSAQIRYKKINGIIFMQADGNWGSFSANSSKVVGVLPLALRPSKNVQFEMTTQRTNNGNRPMELLLNTNGNIEVWSYTAGASNYGGFGITYAQ